MRQRARSACIQFPNAGHFWGRQISPKLVKIESMTLVVFGAGTGTLSQTPLPSTHGFRVPNHIWKFKQGFKHGFAGLFSLEQPF